MIVVRLKGGLGNQMFQYALGRVLALKNQTELRLDTGFFDLNLKNITKRSYDLDLFNIKAELTQSSNLVWALRKIFKIKGQEKSFTFDKKILSITGNVYLEGYWQGPKYFEGFEAEIRKDFTLKNSPAQNIQALAREIENTNSLCIHVRRGDYVGNKNHEVVNNEYYRKGIESISRKTIIDKIYVFSDDTEWCKNNLKFEFPTMFVGPEYAGEKGEGHIYLMSKCKNFIIANSSFSWWAAWLSEHENKIVICPKQWFPDTSIDTSDLIPASWIRI
ncbi:MAG: alpha-1,2-fucosyltransferase [Candidatus Paceibacterota bacterium]